VAAGEAAARTAGITVDRMVLGVPTAAMVAMAAMVAATAPAVATIAPVTAATVMAITPAAVLFVALRPPPQSAKLLLRSPLPKPV
jgi:hypothetical protein